VLQVSIHVVNDRIKEYLQIPQEYMKQEVGNPGRLIIYQPLKNDII